MTLVGIDFSGIAGNDAVNNTHSEYDSRQAFPWRDGIDLRKRRIQL